MPLNGMGWKCIGVALAKLGLLYRSWLLYVSNADECEEYGEYVCFKCLGYEVFRIVMYGNPKSFDALICSCG